MQTTIEKKPLGVIDALSSGFELILRRPWILLLPIALDLFLWLGPQINAKPLFQNMVATIQMTTPADAPAETLQSVEMLKSVLQSAGDTVNIFGIIASGVPTLISVDAPPSNVARRVWITIPDELSFLGWLIPLGLVALFLTSMYWESIAEGVRGDPNSLRTYVLRGLHGFATMTVLAFAVIVALVFLMIPFTIGIALVGLISQGIASFIVLGILLLMFWITLYLAFVFPAIFVHGANVFQAILNSIAVFRFSFWSAMGLILLSFLIRAGFSVIWQFFADNPLGLMLDVVANAFLGSGLIAALTVFYADRMNWLTQIRARLQQQRTQLKG